MQRAGGERIARGRARDMGQRPPAREIHGDGEHDDADGEAFASTTAAAPRIRSIAWTETPTDSAARMESAPRA
jgi:hypothetical protein